jgi:hypothetical protein
VTSPPFREDDHPAKNPKFFLIPIRKKEKK